jgi:hypothetical protein
VFGYCGVPIESNAERDSHDRPLIAGVKLAVDPNQITLRGSLSGRIRQRAGFD